MIYTSWPFVNWNKNIRNKLQSYSQVNKGKTKTPKRIRISYEKQDLEKKSSKKQLNNEKHSKVQQKIKWKGFTKSTWDTKKYLTRKNIQAKPQINEIKIS